MKAAIATTATAQPTAIPATAPVLGAELPSSGSLSLLSLPMVDVSLVPGEVVVGGCDRR